jgi:hypothetical protein
MIKNVKTPIKPDNVAWSKEPHEWLICFRASSYQKGMGEKNRPRGKQPQTLESGKPRGGCHHKRVPPLYRL